MPDDSKVQQAARFLYEEDRARRLFEPIAQAIAPRTTEEAYAIQDAFHTLTSQERGPISGYKIALSTPVMQQLVGFGEPVAGAIFAKEIHQSPAALRWTDYVHFGIECEVGVLLKDGLPSAKAPHDRESVAEAVGALITAFELVDNRKAEREKMNFLDAVAANIWNAGVVLGPQVVDWRGVDLLNARGEMVVNGQLVGEGRCGDAVGHPLDGVAWLANKLAERGKSLSPGMIVITGSIASLQFLSQGDTASVRVEGLGEAGLTIS
jgi:2-keto-4-pentenoate hydratase